MQTEIKVTKDMAQLVDHGQCREDLRYWVLGIFNFSPNFSFFFFFFTSLFYLFYLFITSFFVLRPFPALFSLPFSS
ncbi:hypothetical protein BDZ91DRAFT_725756 [Kalaharituber pfeilii]|nr:hypothetical protein BDZ91DRAFT_725756 [Kalaharituber pfeilii]